MDFPAKKIQKTGILVKPEKSHACNIKKSNCPHSSASLGPYSDDIDFDINDINNYTGIP